MGLLGQLGLSFLNKLTFNRCAISVVECIQQSKKLPQITHKFTADDTKLIKSTICEKRKELKQEKLELLVVGDSDQSMTTFLKYALPGAMIGGALGFGMCEVFFSLDPNNPGNFFKKLFIKPVCVMGGSVVGTFGGSLLSIGQDPSQKVQGKIELLNT